jgi:putative hydrolase of the HAD superfamily
MIGNSLRSDIVPVIELGGWGVHMPYHVTWAHEAEAELGAGMAARVRNAAAPADLPAAVRAIAG